MAIWLAIVTVVTLLGYLSGLVIDEVLWWLSWNYVYGRDEFRADGARIGGVLGTIAAASATMGGRSPINGADLVRGLGVWLVAILACGILCAACGAARGKLRPPGSQVPELAPLTRVYACEGLWRGAALGSVLGCCGASAWWFRRRRGNHE